MGHSDNKKQNVLKALEVNGGNISATCKAESISRQTFYNWMEDTEEITEDGLTFKECVFNITETSIDNVESSLYRKAIEGDTTAIIFFLKTKGKKRGYIEKAEIEVQNTEPDLSKLSTSEILKIVNNEHELS